MSLSNTHSVPYPILQHVIGMWIVAILSLSLIPVVWTARKRTGGGATIILLLAMAIWNIFSGLEFLSTTIEAKFFWMRFAYIGISITPSCTLFASRIFCGDDHPLHPLFKDVLMIIPAITIILVFTDPWHTLMWRDMSVDPVNGAGVWEYGVWFYIWAGFSYLSLITALFVIVRAIVLLRGIHRMQAVSMLLALLPPWIVNGVYLSGVDMGLVQGYDLTPLTSGVTVVMLAINRWAFHFLDRVPVARQRVMESMRQGVLVLDDRYMILDVNQMFCTLSQTEKNKILGKTVIDVFPQYREIWHEILKLERLRYLEYEFEGLGYALLDIAPLYHGENQADPSGWVVLVEDTTEQVRAEQELHRAHDELKSKVEALEEARYAIKTLGNLVPICAECGRRAQLEDGTWVEVSRFIELHSDSEMTHGICPDCFEKFQGEIIK